MGAAALSLLEAKSIRVRYPSGALGVLDVSLAVQPGQVVALTGPNGAGKSTTLRAISGFARSEGARVIHGAIHVAGRDMTNREPYEFSRSGVHCIPERTKVFPHLSVSENLFALGGLPGKEERAQLLKQIEELFPPLSKRRSQQAGRLSGGERQMLAIARGLMARPSLLVIDEMTLGIHPSVHTVLFDAIREIAARGTAILLSDENIPLMLRLADVCYQVESGNVTFVGTPENYVALASRTTSGIATFAKEGTCHDI
jgi:branched-chain amino acid transport system ATP-binding protein